MYDCYLKRERSEIATFTERPTPFAFGVPLVILSKYVHPNTARTKILSCKESYFYSYAYFIVVSDVNANP
jgi:hypothetical protein